MILQCKKVFVATKQLSLVSCVLSLRHRRQTVLGTLFRIVCMLRQCTHAALITKEFVARITDCSERYVRIFEAKWRLLFACLRKQVSTSGPSGQFLCWEVLIKVPEFEYENPTVSVNYEQLSTAANLAVWSRCSIPIFVVRRRTFASALNVNCPICVGDVIVIQCGINCLLSNGESFVW